jgi:hypothetical protein
MRGVGVESDLLSDWDLELEEDRRRSKLGPREDRRPPKMVHKLVFSMPPGSPPRKVLQAVKHFAREEFALQYRYAMVLHLCGVGTYVERPPQPGWASNQRGSHST